MTPYDLLKDLFPQCIARKKRQEGDVVIVMNDQLKIIYLNETSGFFLLCADGQKTISDITSLMKSQYDVALDVLQSDIINLIRDLQWNNIISLAKTPR